MDKNEIIKIIENSTCKEDAIEKIKICWNKKEAPSEKAARLYDELDNDTKNQVVSALETLRKFMTWINP